MWDSCLMRDFARESLCLCHAMSLMCVHIQIPIEDRGPAALPKTVVKRIAVSRHHPLMVTTTSAGSVLLYDLRAPRAAAAHLKPHGSPMV